MSIGRALAQGIRRVGAAPRYLLLVYFLNVAVALVLGFALAGALEDSLGSSLAAGNLRESFDELWYRGFSAGASGLAATFDPAVVGIGAVFSSLDTFLRGGLFYQYAGIVGAGLLYLLAWTFFAGGFIACYRRPAQEGSFFQQGARFFPRFALLAVMAGVLYWLIFHFVAPWAGDRVASLTHETIDERVAFAYTLIQYLLIWCLVWLVSMVFDYSKILVVVQDHRNALTAPLHALGFVRRNLGRALGLYLATGLVWVVLLLVYWAVAPGAGQSSTVPLLIAFLIGQLYILARIAVRCLFYAGQTALYEAVATSR